MRLNTLKSCCFNTIIFQCTVKSMKYQWLELSSSLNTWVSFIGFHSDVYKGFSSIKKTSHSTCHSVPCTSGGPLLRRRLPTGIPLQLHFVSPRTPTKNLLSSHQQLIMLWGWWTCCETNHNAFYMTSTSLFWKETIIRSSHPWPPGRTSRI